MDDVARHCASEITDAMNRACERVGAGAQRDRFVTAAARRILEYNEW